MVWTLLIVPSAIGFVEFPSIAGFTNEMFRPENLYLPVADTGYREAIAMIEQENGPLEVTVPYFPEGAVWAATRDGSRVRIAPSTRPLDEAALVLYPAFYVQYNLVDPKISRDYQLVNEIREGPVTYSYVFARRRADAAALPAVAVSELGETHGLRQSTGH
jgi:hypothetical protein